MANFDLENEIAGRVCGIDEVGRGPLAGPVVAACVYVDKCVHDDGMIVQIKDSKRLSKNKLEELYVWITTHCSYGIGQCSPAEIDELNILWATMEAMKRAYLNMLERRPSEGWDPLPQKSLDCSMRWNDEDPEFHALIDGNRVPPNMPCPATAIVKGDSKSTSIAAASIVAKVTRDRLVAKLAEDYPHYGWERNAAYPSPAHLKALQEHGITPHHRKSFKPVKALI